MEILAVIVIVGMLTLAIQVANRAETRGERETMAGLMTRAQADESRFRRATPPPTSEHHAPKFPTAGQRIEELLAETTRLRDRGKAAVRERDEWQSRATSAEARLAKVEAGDTTTTGSDARFNELRRFLAREFHPDHVKTDGIEKMVRAEVFKKVWPKIEEIAGRQ